MVLFEMNAMMNGLLADGSYDEGGTRKELAERRSLDRLVLIL